MKSKKQAKVLLQDHIHHNLIRSSMVAILVISIISGIIFVVSSTLTNKAVEDILIQKTAGEIESTLSKETSLLQHHLEEVAQILTIFQDQESAFFKELSDKPLPEDLSMFTTHANGALYKPYDNGGSSLYYSADTQLTDLEYKKAYYTESFDVRYKSFVENTPLVAQVYINTYDNMNRLYPMMPDAPTQYGPILTMTEYNFYYLADEAHNPLRQPVWTSAYLDPAGLGWMVSCIVPIYNGDFLEGVTGADITLDRLISSLLNMDLPVYGGVFITDNSGSIIAMTEEIEILFSLEELATNDYTNVQSTVYKPSDYMLSNLSLEGEETKLQSMLGGQHTKTTLTYNNTNYHVQQSTLTNTGWHVFAVFDESALYSDLLVVNESLYKIMVYEALILIVLVILFITLFNSQSHSLAKSISEPIDQLRLATEKIGSELELGALPQNMNIKEIHDLNQQFNRMSEELSKRTKDLIDKESERKLHENLAEKYKREANRDTLTKVCNRRRIDDIISDETKRSRTSDQPLSLILIDIDNFKSINDTYGHAVGDDVLILFSKTVKEHLRASDHIGRWGGEEFLVICPNTDSTQATNVAEKLRAIIENTDFKLDHSVTASFGVAGYQHEDKRTFFTKVDAAMYKAKSMSKNTVVCYQTITDLTTER